MRCIILYIFSCLHLYASAQADSLIVDTSFYTYSAYHKAVKTNPGITIAEELHSKDIEEEKRITYCTVGNRKLLLDVFRPAAKSKINSVAVIIIHGGGWRSGNRAQHYPLAQHLAQLGYSCFTPAYRLSTEAIYPAAVLDIKSAIQWVRQNSVRYSIDTFKIAVLGFSAGGELAAFVGTTGNTGMFKNRECNAGQSSKVNAVIDIDGTLSFVHPESSEGNDSKKLSAATQWLGIAKKDNLLLWKEASPLTYVDSLTPPTLFINSSVAAMHAGREDYLKVLQQHHIYSEVHSFENSPHTFCLFHPWFDPTVVYVDEFLKKLFNKKNGIEN